MVCDSWKAKVDTYLDGELPDEEMRTFDAHVRSCPSCAADVGCAFYGPAHSETLVPRRIPFAFDLPELQNSEFTLLGGRMAYLDQTPGAQLIYDVRKHHISVFVFQERSVNLPASLGSVLPR